MNLSGGDEKLSRPQGPQKGKDCSGADDTYLPDLKQHLHLLFRLLFPLFLLLPF